MATQLPLTRTHFEAALTPATLRTMAILQTALVAGPLIYVTVVLLAFQNAAGFTPGEADFSVLNLLSVITVVVFFAALFLGTFLFEKMFSPTRLSGLEQQDPERLALLTLNHLRSAIILRLSLLEGAAFVGITACVIGIMRGVMQVEPLYYLNLGTVAALLVYGVMTFPSKERILSWFEERFR